MLMHLMLALEEPLQMQTILDLLQQAPSRTDRLTAERLAPSLSLDAADLIRRLLAFDSARRLGSDVFVPAGAKRGWEVRAVATMTSDARAVAAYHKRRVFAARRRPLQGRLRRREL